jgi:HSP20 family molecular chaperone IbpA
MIRTDHEACRPTTPQPLEGHRKDFVMLRRFGPFRELDRITQELLSERRERRIPVDAYRRGNEFKIHLDLPGVDPRFIEFTVEQDLLTVRAGRAWARRSLTVKRDCSLRVTPW